MLLNSLCAILGAFYTLLNNTDLYLSYLDPSYVFPGHNDSVERGPTVICMKNSKNNNIILGFGILYSLLVFCQSKLKKEIGHKTKNYLWRIQILRYKIFGLIRSFV